MFTPGESGIGAIVIQAATSSYLRLEGRVVGFSSAIYGALASPNVQNVSIVAGMFLSTQVAKWMFPTLAEVGNPLGLSTATWALSGLLVGVGTSAGCGCTSGHMLSGLSRLRWRSFVATCTFFATATITNWLAGNAAMWSCAGPCYEAGFAFFQANMNTLVAIAGGSLLWSYAALPAIASSLQNVSITAARALVAVSTGLQFGLGLFVAGMTDPTKVAGFLSFTTPAQFDPSLIMIPFLTIVPNAFLWKQWTPPAEEKPLLEQSFSLNWSDRTEAKFLAGNALFGIGWGLAGVCPGPALLSMFIAGPFSPQGVWMASFLGGAWAEKTLAALW